LGDLRRNARLVRLATALATGGGGTAGGSITSVMRDRHQAKAAYRLLDRAEVKHPAVISGHCSQVLAATATPGDYLLIEDTTAIAYPGLKEARGLGPIGEAFSRGLWAHQTLVVKMDWTQQREQLLGLLGQQVWARPTTKAGRASSARRPKASTREATEAARWMRTLEEAGGPLGETTWTYVADRESDIYELFQSAWAYGWSYVIRAAQPRALRGLEGAADLLTAAATASPRGTCVLPQGEGRPDLHVAVRSTTLTLRGPSRSGGKLEDHTLNVVHATVVDDGQTGESKAADKDAPTTWTLLTDLPVDTLAQCQRVVMIYRRRWLVEELHKALKTGLRVEHSQLSDARRLGALIGILSVVAVFLLQQKLATRDQPQAPLNEQAVDPTLLAVLRKTDPPRGRPTQRWYWIAIAKLGGYHDKPRTHPGWLTLWRGWQTLMILARGYDLARAP
jgi:Transposase DNA-binding/Transposase DDE domain